VDPFGNECRLGTATCGLVHFDDNIQRSPAKSPRARGQPLGPLTTLARAPCECAIDAEHGRFFAISVFRRAILTPMSWGIGVQNLGAN
jgi:hypothetical protein